MVSPALSLSAMGRRDEAQELLEGLKKSVIGENQELHRQSPKK